MLYFILIEEQVRIYQDSKYLGLLREIRKIQLSLNPSIGYLR
jgi:hypothetical protein